MDTNSTLDKIIEHLQEIYLLEQRIKIKDRDFINKVYTTNPRFCIDVGIASNDWFQLVEWYRKMKI